MRRIISRSPWILYGPNFSMAAYPDFLHVTRNDTGEGAAQVGRQNLNPADPGTVSGLPCFHATVQTAPEDPVKYESTS
ncbi:Uncharacterised protein [Salmonella bongori]|nr:Uncharacterised protein [Salmonella bongori]